MAANGVEIRFFPGFVVRHEMLEDLSLFFISSSRLSGNHSECVSLTTNTAYRSVGMDVFLGVAVLVLF